MSVLFHLVTMATRDPKVIRVASCWCGPSPVAMTTAPVLLRGADCVLFCVLARVEAPPSRPLQDQSAALWWKTVPLSNVSAAFCAFRRRSGPDAGASRHPPAFYSALLCNTPPRLCQSLSGRLGQTLAFIFVTTFS